MAASVRKQSHLSVRILSLSGTAWGDALTNRIKMLTRLNCRRQRVTKSVHRDETIVPADVRSDLPRGTPWLEQYPLYINDNKLDNLNSCPESEGAVCRLQGRGFGVGIAALWGMTSPQLAQEGQGGILVAGIRTLSPLPFQPLIETLTAQ